MDLPQGKRLVVYAGTLEPYQGIEILIKAFPYVLAKNPDTFLVIVGGNKKQVNHYLALAEDCGLGIHCAFTGSVPQYLAKE